MWFGIFLIRFGIFLIAPVIVLIVWHTKGILQLQEDFRGLYARKKKNSTIFWIECSSDLTGRTMDIWTTTPGSHAKKGGELKREIDMRSLITFVPTSAPVALMTQITRLSMALLVGLILADLRKSWLPNVNLPS